MAGARLKDGLFEAAVAEPLQARITAFLDSWRGHEPASSSNAEIVKSFMILFQETLQRNRSLFLAYFLTPALAARGDGAAEESMISRELTVIARRVEDEVSKRGFVDADIPVAVRCAAGTALSMSMHGELLFPTGAGRPEDGRILDEMVACALAGIERRTTSGPTAEQE